MLWLLQSFDSTFRPPNLRTSGFQGKMPVSPEVPVRVFVRVSRVLQFVFVPSGSRVSPSLPLLRFVPSRNMIGLAVVCWRRVWSALAAISWFSVESGMAERGCSALITSSRRPLLRYALVVKHYHALCATTIVTSSGRSALNFLDIDDHLARMAVFF